MLVVLPAATTDFERKLVQALQEFMEAIDNDINQARRPNVKSITADYTLGEFDNTILVDATSAGVTVTLPSVAKSIGRVISVKKTDASGNTVTLDAEGAELIDGATTSVISTQYETIKIHSDGSAWWKL